MKILFLLTSILAKDISLALNNLVVPANDKIVLNVNTSYRNPDNGVKDDIQHSMTMWNYTTLI